MRLIVLHITLFLLLILCVPYMCIATETPPAMERMDAHGAEPLIMCIPTDNPPFSFINSEGKLDGFHLEVLNHLRLKRPVQIETPDVSMVPIRLQDGSCHMALSNISITKERERLFLFSQPYMQSSIHALVFKESSITNKDNLLYSIIGVRKGDAAEEYAFKYLTGSTLYALRETDSLVNMLLDGSIEAIIDARAFLLSVVNTHDQLHILEPPLFLENYAYAFPPGQGQLRDEINRELLRLEESGFLNQIHTKWLIDHTSPTH